MKVLWIVTAGFLIVVVSVLGVWRFGAVAFVSDVPGAATKAIGALLAVTLLIERSLAAINAAVFGTPKKMDEARLKDLELGVDLKVEKPEDARNSAKLARDNIAKIEGKEQQVRVALGFAFAVLASAAGVRTLSALLMIDASGGLPDGTQKDLCHMIDIILAAGLITGGSNGLAQLLQVIRDGIKPRPKFL